MIPTNKDKLNIKIVRDICIIFAFNYEQFIYQSYSIETLLLIT